MFSMPIYSSTSEPLRLAELHKLDLLDTPKEAEFDAIVAIARRLFNCTMSTVTLVDEHRQWFKAVAGSDSTGCSRQDSICATAMYEPDLLVVPDLSQDARFADNPIVAAWPGMRFYAGVPLRPTNPALPGIGTLCIMDPEPRAFTSEDAEQLRHLAVTVCAVIRARVSAAAARNLSVEVKASFDMIERQNAQLRQAERMVGVGSWRYDLLDQSITWSDQVFEIHGLPVGRVPGYEEAMSFYTPASRARIASLIARASDLGEAFDVEGDFITADGRRRRVRSMGEAQVVDGSVASLIGVFQDVTERHQREQQLSETANTDTLTALPNRRDFEHRLDQAIRHAAASGEPLALMLIDLDGFKAVNDTLGHGAGDEVLRAVAERIKVGPLSRTYAARLGGDEFVLLVTRPRDCAELGKFVQLALRTLCVAVNLPCGRRLVSATIGAAGFAGEEQSATDLLRRADLALYEAKRHARGTGRIYGSVDEICVQSPPTCMLVAL